MAKCHRNRRLRKRRYQKELLRVAEEGHQRKTYYPPGYSMRRANYGFDVYREPETHRGFRNDARVGGYRHDDGKIALRHAWADWDAQSESFRNNAISNMKIAKKLIEMENSEGERLQNLYND